MHNIVREHLESYLEGRCTGSQQEAIDNHLAGCSECRDLLEQIVETNHLIQVLKCPSFDLEPAPGFYARVMGEIERRQRASFWSFLLDPVFGRRLVLASLALVVILGSFMAATSPEPVETANAPEAILAAPRATETAPSENVDRDRDAILVQLATYRE